MKIFESETMNKFKKNYQKGRLSLTALLILFLISLALAFLAAYFIPKVFGQNVSVTLQALVVIAAGLPTVYLWIVNQRKKEHDVNFEAERELNNRYVKAVEQLYNSESFMAGAYAVASLITDWYDLEIPLKKKRTQMEHLTRILLNIDRDELVVKNQSILNQYLQLCRTVLLDEEHLELVEKGEKYTYNLLNLSNLDLSNQNDGLFSKLKPIKLYSGSLEGTVLSETNLEKANLRGAKLAGAILFKIKFDYRTKIGSFLGYSYVGAKTMLLLNYYCEAILSVRDIEKLTQFDNLMFKQVVWWKKGIKEASWLF